MQKVITNASDLASVLLGGAEVKFVNDKLIVVELSREQAEQERRRAEQAKYVAAEDFANAYRDTARAAYKAQLQQLERQKALDAARQIPVSALTASKKFNLWMANNKIENIADLLGKHSDSLPANSYSNITGKIRNLLPFAEYPGAVWSDQIHNITVTVPDVVDIAVLNGLVHAKLELLHLTYNRVKLNELGPQALDDMLHRILQVLHKERIPGRATRVDTVAFTPKGREEEGALHLDVYYDHYTDNYFGVDGSLLPDSEGLVYSPYNLDFPLQVSDGSEALAISGSTKSPESAPAQ